MAGHVRVASLDLVLDSAHFGSAIVSGQLSIRLELVGDLLLCETVLLAACMALPVLTLDDNVAGVTVCVLALNCLAVELVGVCVDDRHFLGRRVGQR